MKNLRKLSKQELKSVNGGIVNCPNISMYGYPTPKCPCNPHTQIECNGQCVPKGQLCPTPPIGG
ncbi:hypothetical protein GCM10023210_26810 [Chryseobacterium ginsengisoli]|uniref:Bacteriocin n=1 Tax=Chryseobacterium ginsengisoli TaxID=363853 RepID=A0ABP9MGS3_9FLAO